MTLKTSFFNPALFKKNLTRFWPLWAIFAGGWFLALPCDILHNVILGENARTSSYYIAEVNETVAGAAATSSVVGLVAGVVVALTVFSYLFQHRSVVTIHALPMRRSGLFFTNYLSGLAMLVIPLAANMVLLLIVEAIGGYVNVAGVLMWVTAQFLSYFFFYSFAVFCAMLTGHICAMPVIYVGLNMVCSALYWVLHSALSLFLYGYSYLDGVSQLVRWFSPGIQLIQTVVMNSRILPGTETTVYFIDGWKSLVIYFLVGIVLVCLALALYLRRNIESAGDVVAVGFLRPIFKYGIAVCAALGFASCFYYLISGDKEGGIRLAAYILMALVGGFLGFFGAQMLLDKSLRVFRGHWKGYGIVMAAVVVFVLGTYFDVLGFGRWVPQLDNVQSVSVDCNSVLPGDSFAVSELAGDVAMGNDITDPEVIRQVIALQSTVIADKAQIQAQLEAYRENPYYRSYTNQWLDEEELWRESHDQNRVWLVYTMKDGSVRARNYAIYVDEAELADETSAAAQLTTIINTPAYKDASYQLLRHGFTADKCSIGLSTCEINGTNYTDTYVTLVNNNAQGLLSALLEDYEAGRLGRQYLLESEVRDYYNYNPLDVDIRTAEEQTILYAALTLNPECTASIAFLEGIGILDETHIMANARDIMQYTYGDDYVYYDDAAGAYVSSVYG